MWWCCGKNHKDAPGCKFSKHLTKDEEDDEFETEKDGRNEERKDMSTKCYCCKEYGHKTEHCTKDPNLRNTANLTKELERVEEQKNQSKKVGLLFKHTDSRG